MYALVIILIATSLQSPKPHQVLKVSLPYDAQAVCETAERDLNADFINKVYSATHKKLHVLRVVSFCERNLTLNS